MSTPFLKIILKLCKLKVRFKNRKSEAAYDPFKNEILLSRRMVKGGIPIPGGASGIPGGAAREVLRQSVIHEYSMRSRALKDLREVQAFLRSYHVWCLKASYLPAHVTNPSNSFLLKIVILPIKLIYR
jgi:hypothetical protein